MEFKILTNRTFQFSIPFAEFVERYSTSDEIFLCLLIKDLIREAFREIPNQTTTADLMFKTIRFESVDSPYGVSKQLVSQWYALAGIATPIPKHGLGTFVRWNTGTSYSMLAITGIDEENSEYREGEQYWYRLNALQKCLENNPDAILTFNLRLQYGDKFTSINTFRKGVAWLNGWCSRLFSW